MVRTSPAAREARAKGRRPAGGGVLGGRAAHAYFRSASISDWSFFSSASMFDSLISDLASDA